ncbi:energy transducer TonB family protein [Nannocystis radixulma]|uniref:Energy transducer TonB n=1 Tax=Nannocystis radixulma TaxID=2995305 RepID=A0ABT5BQE2_9BACT|nr:energy transducer TonB [Nannocystis radixulma]MDC0675156.1 energy transducer TonB [Nannocystis radixulma]
MTRPGIAAQVFAAAAPPASRRHHAIVVAVLLHLGLAVLILRAQPTLETWSATMAARVHDELTRLQLADVEPAEPPKPPPEPAPPEPPPPATEPAPAVAAATPPAPAPAPRPAPARAARVVAAPPGALDLTGDVVVVGSASAYVGGATSSTGTGTKPVPNASSQPTPAPPAPPPAEPPPAAPPTVDRSRPVALASAEWNCPWPAEADGLALDEQVAVIRVVVDARGVVETAEVVDDPGDGFGRAALACARVTRFSPALDRDGHPLRARSPAIRVHFTRDR